MTYVFVGVIGIVLGLAGHDLAIQALDDETPLRPLAGTCRTCRRTRGWHRLRCPNCRTRIAREPVVAVATGLASAGFYSTIGWDPTLVPYLGFLLLTTALIVTDLEEFRIVDRLNLPGSAILAVLLLGAAGVTGEWDRFLRGLGGAAAYFVGASVLFLLVRGQGFGAGDVKLAPQLGLFTAYLGWSVLGWAVFATAVIGGLVAVIMMIAGAAGRKTELPYGPPMVLGAWTAILLVGVGAVPIPP